MTELEAWNWLKSHYSYNLTKYSDRYTLFIVGMGDSVSESSVLECVIKLKGRVGV